MIYAGEGEPDASIGDMGDYYLNQNTGELYGPKDSDGWGDDPIIVLMGEDGQDGEDGADGSVIHSGEGAPDANIGKNGDYYFDESSGEFYGSKTDDSWGEPTDLTGNDGEDGEDGSVIHASDGAPSDDLGEIGDYYLDKSTGELYGPKTEDGWTDSINLTGEDGQDGQDGADGEDGSQIYSGNGAPDSELGVVGDYYLDKDSHNLYGPKTSDGWGSPLNLKGADGNANVTRYIFPGHEFNPTLDGGDGDTAEGCIQGIGEQVMYESAWLYYLVDIEGKRYSIPSWGVDGVTAYRVNIQFSTSTCSSEPLWTIKAQEMERFTPDNYDQIEVVHIGSSETIDTRSKQKGNSIIPDHLDTSNYQEVAEYYSFWNEQ